MWIESHQDLEEHPKLLELCNRTGWDLDQAIGKLHRLWWWTLRYAEDGNLSRYKPSQFLVRLNGKHSAEELYKILQDTKFIEKNGLIHDWMDYSGRYLTAKYRTSNPKELQRIERLHRSVYGRTKVGQDNQPKITIPNLTNIIKDVVFYLNIKTNQNYKDTTPKTQTLIKARLEEKFTLENFKTVIDIKTKEWLNTDMAKYLRPETLFGTKFESYLNQKGVTNGSTKGSGSQYSEGEEVK